MIGLGKVMMRAHAQETFIRDFKMVYFSIVNKPYPYYLHHQVHK